MVEWQNKYACMFMCKVIMIMIVYNSSSWPMYLIAGTKRDIRVGETFVMQILSFVFFSSAPLRFASCQPAPPHVVRSTTILSY